LAEFQHSKRRMSQTASAFLLLAPFLFTYSLFLVFPFFKGVWISLHDWNLLEVSFNPAAAEFVGLRNFERVMWGKNIQWSPTNSVYQLLALLGFLAVIVLRIRGLADRTTMIAGAVIAMVAFIAMGFYPGEGGRWYDRRFWPTVGNTILFVCLTVPSVVVSALIIATMLNRETRWMAAFRTIFFVSQVLSVTVVTLIWQIMFSPRQGLIANVTELFAQVPVVWLTDENLAMTAIVITTIWWSLGIAMILFLAGLQDISKDLYEAAALDNATGIRAFWYITLPNLTRTITLVVVLQIILHFQVFGQAHLMTGGGPSDSTQVLVRYIYQTGFRDSDLGRASAMAVFLFLIMGSFSVIQFIVGRERA